jgi:hypothetical protein
METIEALKTIAQDVSLNKILSFIIYPIILIHFIIQICFMIFQKRREISIEAGKIKEKKHIKVLEKCVNKFQKICDYLYYPSREIDLNKSIEHADSFNNYINKKRLYINNSEMDVLNKMHDYIIDICVSRTRSKIEKQDELINEIRSKYCKI